MYSGWHARKDVTAVTQAPYELDESKHLSDRLPYFVLGFKSKKSFKGQLAAANNAHCIIFHYAKFIDQMSDRKLNYFHGG